MSTTSLAKMLAKMQDRIGEPIEQIVVGLPDDDYYSDDDSSGAAFSPQEYHLVQDDPLLHREFNDDYGTVHGAPIVAWTKNFVIFSVQYDGSEWLAHVPRNPVTTAPHFYGR